nr:hypothetical protein [Tanacetum cinerariifolium]
MDIVSEPEEAPLETKELQPLAAGIAPPSDHTPTSSNPTPVLPLIDEETARMAVRTQHTLSPGFSARLTEAMTLSLSSFRKRYRSSYETHTSSAPSPTLPIRKRYRVRHAYLASITDSKSEPFEDSRETEIP